MAGMIKAKNSKNPVEDESLQNSQEVEETEESEIDEGADTEDVVEAKIPEIQVTIPDTTPDQEEPAAPAPPKVTVSREPRVKVKTVRDHKCNIGGTQYYFVKGVEQVVPAFVKEVLRKAKLLAAL